MQRKDSKKEENLLINSLKPDGVLEINLISRRRDTIDISKSDVLWADRDHEKILYNIFQAVKDDLSWIMILRNLPENTFDRTCEVLFQRFLKSSENHPDLENVIEEEIQ